MSYIADGKIYTDHALMDEIVYNSKIIVNGLVLKNETEANNNEVKKSVEQADYFMAVNDNSMDLHFFPLTVPILEEYGYDTLTAKKIVADRSLIPEDDYEDLLTFCKRYFLREYVEYNNYYRMLNGKPDYDPQVYIQDDYSKINIRVYNPTKEEWEIQPRYISLNSNGCHGRIYINVRGSDGVYRNKQYYLIDHAIYIHKVEIIYNGWTEEVPVTYEKFDNKTFYHYFQKELSEDDDNLDLKLLSTLDACTTHQIVGLDSLGILPKVIDLFFTSNKDNPKRYKYLTFMGPNQIDIYTARKANNWDILYCPDCNDLVQARFIELYNINRQIMSNQTYQLAYQYNSEYYDQMMMVMTICQTFADMIVDVPEWYIRRDIFDLRSVKYFLDSYGVKFFKIIPLKWQVRIVKGLNKLISYKSTEKNIRDILDIFNTPEAEVYNYYIYKNYQYTEIPPDPIDEDPDWDMEDEMDMEDDDWVLNCGDAEERTMPDFDIITASYEFYRRGEGSEADELIPDIDDDELFRIYDFGEEEGYKPQDEFDCGYLIPEEAEVDYIDEEGFIHTSYYDYTSIFRPLHRDKKDPTTGYIYAIPDAIYDCEEITPESEDISIEELDCGNEDGEMIWSGDETDEVEDYQEKIKVITDEFGNVYKLEFLRVPLGESYDDYIKDSINRYQYDQITYQDKYWDGQDVHYLVRNNHLRKDFMIEGTKFMALQYNVDMAEVNFQKEYYLGLYFNSGVDTNDLMIPVPSIKRNAKFSLQNLFLFLVCCNGLMNDSKRGSNVLDVNITTIDNSKSGVREGFKPYRVVDGGRPWSVKKPNTPIVEPEKEWELEDMDFYNDTFDPPEYFIINEDTVIYDFGFNYVIDPNDEVREYDFGMITSNSLDYDIDIESEKEAVYLGLFPITDLEDYGDEEFDVPRNEFTMIDGYGDEDGSDPMDHLAEDTEGLRNPYIMDYFGGDLEPVYRDSTDPAEMELIDNGTANPGPDEEIIDPDTGEITYPDFDEITEYSDYGEAPYGEENTHAAIRDWYEVTDTLEAGRPSEIYMAFSNDNVVNSVDQLPVYGIEGVGYYVQSGDITTLFQVYEWSESEEAYILVGNYGTGEDPTDAYPYDFKVRLTWDNYTIYINHYLLLDDGSLLLISDPELLAPYIGKIKKFRYPWYNLIEEEYIEFDYDGHHLQKDKEQYDVMYDKFVGYIRLDRTDYVPPLELVDEYWQDMIDGGRVTFSIPTKIRLNLESYYDWMRYYYPDIWVNLTNRIYGFNMNVDLEVVEKMISNRHSSFGWTKGYTLADLGCDTFINNTKLKELNNQITYGAAKFKDLDQLYYVYTVNKSCYDSLLEKIQAASTRDERNTYVYVFNQLFTHPYNRNFYMLKNGEYATTYHELLKERDITLYSVYKELRSETKDELRHDLTRQIMNDLVDTLNYYLRSDNLRYVLSFVSTNSFDAIINYILLMIDFFKSWKVQFLNNVVSYKLADQIMGDSNAPTSGIDTLEEIRHKLWSVGNAKPRDAVTVRPVYWAIEDPGTDPNFEAEVVDIAAHYVDDNIMRHRIYDGGRIGAPKTLGSTIFSSDGFDVLSMDGSRVTNWYTSGHYQENGGRIARRSKPRDLDGGYAIPVSEDRCIIINGGHPGDNKQGPITRPIDHLKKYTINVDGGIVSFRKTQSDTLIVLIDDLNYIECSVKISPFYNNMLEVKSGYEYIVIREIECGFITPDSIDYSDDDEEFEILDFGEITESSVEEPYDGFTDYDFGFITRREELFGEDGPNGLYYDESPYLTVTDLLGFKNEAKKFYDSRMGQLDNHWDIIEYLLSSMDPHTMITEIYEEFFYTAKSVLRRFPFEGYSLFEEEIQDNISSRINAFDQWTYDTNPFQSTWQSFSDAISEDESA